MPPAKKKTTKKPEKNSEKTYTVESNLLNQILILVVILVVIIGVAFMAVNLYQAKKELAEVKEQNSEQVQQEQLSELLDKVAMHMILPEEESPMIATIEDVEKLKNEEPFYARAENGDKLLIFSNKAIIYRESLDKIVNVGPVFLKDQVQTEQMNNEEPEQLAVIKLDIRNGSTVVGEATAMGEKYDPMEEYEVINIANAKDKNYQETLLIKTHNIDVSALETELGVTAIEALPEGEAETDADVVIIIGG